MGGALGYFVVVFRFGGFLWIATLGLALASFGGLLVCLDVCFALLPSFSLCFVGYV